MERFAAKYGCLEVECNAANSKISSTSLANFFGLHRAQFLEGVKNLLIEEMFTAEN